MDLVSQSRRPRGRGRPLFAERNEGGARGGKIGRWGGCVGSRMRRSRKRKERLQEKG